jgi:hypothetical protein
MIHALVGQNLFVKKFHSGIDRRLPAKPEVDALRIFCLGRI